MGTSQGAEQSSSGPVRGFAVKRHEELEPLSTEGESLTGRPTDIQILRACSAGEDGGPGSHAKLLEGTGPGALRSSLIGCGRI
jgi:hypothetical protein